MAHKVAASAILWAVIVAILALLPSMAAPAASQSPAVEPSALQTFTDIGASLTGFFGHAAWGDYDGDGDLDFVVTGLSNSIQDVALYRNDGGDVFTEVVTALAGTWAGQVAWGDYDSDGDLDLLLTGVGGRTTKIYRNDGGNFVDIGAALPGLGSTSVEWGDYDNDGDLDFVISGEVASQTHITRVFRNDGEDTFTETGVDLPGVRQGTTNWGDYDNDGDLDLLLAGEDDSFDPITAVYRNDGGDVFVDIGANLVQLYGSGAWGDYDGDGDLDIAFSGGESPSFRIYRNDGANVFTGLGGSLDSIAGSVNWGDYDNDGDLDLVVSGRGPSWTRVTRVYRNDGADHFTDTSAALMQLYFGSAEWGDYDDDGDLDILLNGTGEGFDDFTKIYRNDGVLANTPASPPAGLTASAVGIHVLLGWDQASDVETPANGLNYNLRIGTTPGGGDALSPMAASSGYRRLPAIGNTGPGRAMRLDLVPNTTYYWSVQAIDGAWAGSAFAPEGIFTTGDDAPIVAGFTPSSQSVPVDETVTFTNTSTGPAPLTFAWSFGDGATSTATDPTHTYTTAGTFTTVLTVTNGYDTDYTSLPISVWVPVEPQGVDFSFTPRVPVRGQAVLFRAEVTAGSQPMTYDWSFGDGNMGTGPEVSHTYAAGGTYPVQLIVANLVGSVAAIDTITVTAQGVPPTAAFNVSGDSSPGGTVYLTNLTTGSEPMTFAWDLGDGTESDETHVSHRFQAPGTYDISLTAANAYGTGEATATLVVGDREGRPTTWVVDTIFDSNKAAYQACTDAAVDCSLRGAVSRANSEPDVPCTVILPAGVYTLTLAGAGEDANATGDLDVVGNVEIVGIGDVTIDGVQLDRVLHVLETATVDIHTLNVRGGKASSGAGIYNSGTLTIHDSTVGENQAVGSKGSTGISGSHAGGDCIDGSNGSDGSDGGSAYGGGIYNAGILTLTHSTLGANQVMGGEGGGGGTGGDGGSAIISMNGTIVCPAGDGGTGGDGGDAGSGRGGGLYNTGKASLVDSQVADNVARGGTGGRGEFGGSGGNRITTGTGTGGYGGVSGLGGDGGDARGAGIDNTGTLTVTGTFVVSNTTTGGTGGSACPSGMGGAPGNDGGQGGASHGGAGIYAAGTLHVTRSWVTGNLDEGGAGGHGGSASTRVEGSNVLYYSAGDGGDGGSAGSGGGILSAGTLYVANTIFAGQTIGSGGEGGEPGSGLLGTTGTRGAKGDGSALSVRTSSAALVHVTVAANTGGRGAGIEVVSGASLSMQDAIVAGHLVGLVVTGSADLDGILWGSGAWANDANWTATGTVHHTHDEEGDPAFVDAGAGDYHIGPTSAAIERGVHAGLTADVDYQPRPNPAASAPDLGADEYWPCTPVAGVTIDGPSDATAGQILAFDVAIMPAAATPTVRYTWRPEPETGQGTASSTYRWRTPGIYWVTVAVDNCGGEMRATHVVEIHDLRRVYLPLVSRGSARQ